MKNRKFWITSSLICVILGIVLTVAGRLMGGIPGFYIDRTGVHAAASQNASKPIQDTVTLDGFDSMEIHADYADVELVSSDRFAVEYCIRGNIGDPVCEVRDGRLIFQEATLFQTYGTHGAGFFTISTGMVFHEPSYYVKVMIPEDTKLSEAVFDIENGDLDISSIQADTLTITDEYGDVAVEQLKSKSLDIRMESGTLSLGTLNALQTSLDNEYGQIMISEATGSSLTIKMESCGLKAGRLNYSDVVITDEYGDVTIDDMSGERLEARLESGDCSIDRMDCLDTKLVNSYGNIHLGLPGEMDDYGFDLKTEYGSIRIGDHRERYDSDDSNAVYMVPGDGNRMVKATCESGNIKIESAK